MERRRDTRFWRVFLLINCDAVIQKAPHDVRGFCVFCDVIYLVRRNKIADSHDSRTETIFIRAAFLDDPDQQNDPADKWDNH